MCNVFVPSRHVASVRTRWYNALITCEKYCHNCTGSEAGPGHGYTVTSKSKLARGGERREKCWHSMASTC